MSRAQARLERLFPNASVNIKYVKSITAKGRYRVVWEDGTETIEPRGWRETIEGVDEEQLLDMANRHFDSQEVKADKAVERERHAARTPQGIKRRRTGICAACGLDGAARQCVAQCTSLICAHCFDSGLVVSFTCPAHGGGELKLSHDVAIRGVPLFTSVNYHVVSVDPSLSGRISAPDTVLSDKADAHVVFVNYHSDPDWTSKEHIAFINSALDGAVRAKLVVVLTCWKNGVEQRLAMKQLSYDHPRLLFVTYRIDELVLTPQLLGLTLVHAADAVRLRRPYVPLSNLCTLEKGAVFFEGGAGPYQVAYNSKPLCGCGRAYPSASKRREDNVRRRKCGGGTPACVDLLTVA